MTVRAPEVPGALVALRPENRHVFVPPGVSVQRALVRAGVAIDAPCNGGGRCGKCRVRVEPASAVPRTPHDTITEQQAADGMRLGCQVQLTGGSFAVEVLDGDEQAPQSGSVRAHRASPNAELGLAVDIGTTTLGATLIELSSGRELDTLTAVNPQRSFGHDVISRIHHGSTAEGLAELSTCIREALRNLATELTRSTHASPDRIARVTLGGNPAMLQLAAAIDPSPLGSAPFTASYRGGDADVALFGLDCFRNARAYVPPVIDAFIGADITSGLVAISELLDGARSALFVDLGTNGEIVLRHGDAWHATSTAAGPAFEGMGLSCGMRAAPGAISRVGVVGNDLGFHVLGGGAPRGVCGSGVIDLCATLLRLGVLDETGRLLADGASQAIGPELRDRLVRGDDVPAVALADDVALTQKDIRQLQLAKGAIRTAVETLLARAGIERLDRLVVAGGLGAHLDLENAERIGLFPAAVAEEFEFAGNTSLGGCRDLLCDGEARRWVESLTSQVQTLDLAQSPDYFDRFAEHMGFGG